MTLPLPPGWTKVPVVCQYGTLNEGDLQGERRVVFVSTAGPIKVGGVVVVPAKIVASVGVDGLLEADFELPATNDPDLSETGWGYTVFEQFTGGRDPYTIVVPYDAVEIDLATVPDSEPEAIDANPALRNSDIGVKVASQAAVETAQVAADGAAAAAAAAQGSADAHSARIDNPHAVTAAQVGAIPTVEKGAANGVASLGADGKIPVGQVPKIAITDVAVVESEAEQLALVAEEGDVAKRTDFTPAKTYIHNGGVAGTMADWTEIENPDLAGHEAAPDPHPGYVLESLLGQAGSPPALDAAAILAAIVLAKKRVAAVPAAGALSIDLSLGADFYVALTANVTSTAFSNGPPAGYAREGTLIFVQDATGGRTWTPPAGAKWPNGLAAVLTSAANAVDHMGYRVYNNAGTLEYTFYPVRDVRAP